MDRVTSPDVRTPWRKLVFRSDNIKNTTRVLLLYLGEHMRRDGVVSVPVTRIQDALGIPPSRISERVAEGHRQGLLDTVEAGRHGRTATYRALLPASVPKLEGRKRTGGLVDQRAPSVTPVRNETLPPVRNPELRTTHASDRYGPVEAAEREPITDGCGASTTTEPWRSLGRAPVALATEREPQPPPQTSPRSSTFADHGETGADDRTGDVA